MAEYMETLDLDKAGDKPEEIVEMASEDDLEIVIVTGKQIGRAHV